MSPAPSSPTAGGSTTPRARAAAVSADVVSLVDEVLAAAERHGAEEQAARLRGVRDRLLRPTRHVVVVGEYKKGKSSLVNALLNMRVCPTDADIATAIPSYLRHGQHLRVRALTDNASPLSQDPGEDLAVTTAESVATGSREPSSGEGRAGVPAGPAALDIQVPRELLADGIVLVDTPGIGGGLGSAHAAAALRALRSTASVALVVTDASGEYTASELDFVRAVLQECPHVLAVVTKTDLYPQWRDVLAASQRQLGELGADVEVLALSAHLRREALATADDDLNVESGFPALTARVVEAARDRSGPVQAETAAAAKSVLSQLIAAVGDRRTALAEEGTAAAEEARRAWADSERLAGDLGSAGARWQQVLSDQIVDLQAEIDVDLVTRIRALRKEAVTRVAELPRQRMAADLGPWLQRRTNEELLDHVRVVRAGALGVADAVADQFGTAARSIRAAVELTDSISSATDTLTDAATAAALSGSGGRTPGSESGMAALRGGATGAVVANALGLAFGMAVPVLVPVTVALAATLAGKSWHSARGNAERQLRVELERAVVSYLDDVDVLARKDSRAGVRAVQRELREGFTAAAVELQRTARRTSAQLQREADSDRTDREAALAALDREVTVLRRLHARASRAVADHLPEDRG